MERENRSDELVVLIHGMGRTSLSMVPLAWTLKGKGYQILNWGYSSTRFTVAELGEKLADRLKRHPRATSKVHFVGHSLGTVITRWVLANGVPPEMVGRVVMLAPPNRGSARADRAARRWSWLFKPLPELGTADTSTARVLNLPAGVDVGIIAGAYDGKVSVSETHLPDATEHLTVPAAHSFLMLRRDVKLLVIRFLETGSFGEAGGGNHAAH